MRILSMRRRAARLIGAGAVCLALAGTVVSSASGAGTKSQVVVKEFKSVSMGTFLTTTSGMPLYTYKHDAKNHSNCAASCLATWPALTVAKGVRPIGAPGLGTFKRPNGVIQVTWHGWPLYTFTSDTAGQATGNNVGGFKLAVTKSASTHGGGHATTTVGGAG